MPEVWELEDTAVEPVVTATVDGEVSLGSGTHICFKSLFDLLQFDLLIH